MPQDALQVWGEGDNFRPYVRIDFYVAHVFKTLVRTVKQKHTYSEFHNMRNSVAMGSLIHILARGKSEICDTLEADAIMISLIVSYYVWIMVSLMPSHTHTHTHTHTHATKVCVLLTISNLIQSFIHLNIFQNASMSLKM
jgi:hypothetical protein